VQQHIKQKTELNHAHTECRTHYQTQHFFNNSNTNEDIATKFEQEYILFFHISYTVK